MVRRKVHTFHWWLNLAMEDIFLGHLFLFVSVIPLSKLGSLERVHEPTGEWAEQDGRGGKNTNFEASRRLPRTRLSYTLWPRRRKQCVNPGLLHLHNVTFEISPSRAIYKTTRN